jgi:hypothetical protein
MSQQKDKIIQCAQNHADDDTKIEKGKEVN